MEERREPVPPPPPRDMPKAPMPGTVYNYGPSGGSVAQVFDSAWLKLVGTICGLIGGLGSAIKVLTSFCKGCWKVICMIFKRKEKDYMINI